MARLLLPLLLGLASGPGAEADAGLRAPNLKADWKPVDDLYHWLPEGDRTGNEYKRGNTLRTTIGWSGPGPANKARVVALLKPTQIRGANGNSGSDTLPDFFFEKSLNPGWSFTSDYTDKIEDVQALQVSILLARGERAGLVISSFDWGGRFKIEVRAERP